MNTLYPLQTRDNLQRLSQAREDALSDARQPEQQWDRNAEPEPRIPNPETKAKQRAQCLGILQEQLEKRDLDILPVLEKLYGRDLRPNSERGQIICMHCERLLYPDKYGTESEEQFRVLLGLVALEENDAVTAYGLCLDKASLPRSARLARLGPVERDRAMNLQGDRLRYAIDRKQRLIMAMLRMLRLNEPEEKDRSDTSAPTGKASGVAVLFQKPRSKTQKKIPRFSAKRSHRAL